MLEGLLMLGMLTAVFLIAWQAKSLLKNNRGRFPELFYFYENLDHKAQMKARQKKEL